MTDSPKPSQTRDFIVDGNELRLLPDGEDRFAALIDLIAAARSEVRLFYYIFAADETGRAVRDALTDACNRGVSVRLIIDAFGSEPLPVSFFDDLVAAGGTVRRFLPGFGRRMVLRNHQKMAIADRDMALIGGCNIENSYFDRGPPAARWVDLMLRLRGPAVRDLVAYFDDLDDWVITVRDGIGDFRALLLRHSQRGVDRPIAWLFSGPFARINPYARDLRRMFGLGRSVHIVAGYFAPPWGVIRRLAQLARRASVRVITPSVSDNRTTIGAARHCYGRLLRSGTEIAEYQPAKLHMKMVIVDDYVYIGSANFDVRSLFINAELMVRVRDAGFAAAARALFDALQADSRVITQEKLDRAAGFWARQLWRIAYYVVATIDPTVTRRMLRRVVYDERASVSSRQPQ